jgi:cytochrome oxidase Cu insertion factor (SCO1/SenC/PrrC family)
MSKPVRRSILAFGLAAIAAALVVLAVRLYLDNREAADAGLGRAAIGGPFTLVDHNGRTVTDADYRGKLLLVFFGYTYCPDVCPTELQNLTLALEDLGKDAGSRVQGLFITVDPGRDTPQALKEYLSNFHPAITGLTGTPEQIAAAARTYKAYYARAKGEGDVYLMDHSAFLYLMDRKNEYVAHFRPGVATADIVAGVKKALR